MRKFLIQLLIFTSPLTICLGYQSFILWRSKENFNTIDKLITGKEKYLIGYKHEKNYHYVKWAYLNENEKKDIWALGSSRVLQFRDKMFDSSFYNVGYTIESINDFRTFLKSIPEAKHPKYIIIALDQWMFNLAWEKLTSKATVNSWQNSFSIFPSLTDIYPFYKDFYKGKYPLKTLLRDNPILKIGLNATFNNTGFRNDGSMYYGGQIAKLLTNDKRAADYKYSNTFERIKKGNRRFEYGKSVNEKALVELNELLKYCKEHQIEVVGFLPPFADMVFSKLIETNHYDYMKEIYSKVKPIFYNYKYEMYDFSRVSLCNSNDSETIDGFHGGELTYQKMLINMMDSGSILNRVTNIERLKSDLAKNKNNYIIYDY